MDTTALQPDAQKLLKHQQPRLSLSSHLGHVKKSKLFTLNSLSSTYIFMFKTLAFGLLLSLLQPILPAFSGGLDLVREGVMTQEMYDSLVAAEESQGFQVRLLTRTQTFGHETKKQVIALVGEYHLKSKTHSEKGKRVLNAFHFRGLEGVDTSSIFSLSSVTVKMLEAMRRLQSKIIPEQDHQSTIRDAHLPRLFHAPIAPPIPPEERIEARPQTLAEAIAEAMNDEPHLPGSALNEPQAGEGNPHQQQYAGAQALDPALIPIEGAPEPIPQKLGAVSQRTPSERHVLAQTLQHLLKNELPQLLPEALGAASGRVHLEDLSAADRNHLALYFRGIGLRSGPISFQSIYEHREEILRGDLRKLDPIEGDATVNFNLEDQHKPDFWENLSYSRMLVSPTLLTVTLCTYLPYSQCWISPELSSYIRTFYLAFAGLHSLGYAIHFGRGYSLEELPTYLSPHHGIINGRNQTMSKNINQILNDYPEISAFLVIVGKFHGAGMEKLLTETYGFTREALR